MHWTRRDFLLAAAAATLLPATPTKASRRRVRPVTLPDPTDAPVASSGPRRSPADLITRAIPSTGERLPVIGIGTRNFRTEWADGEDTSIYRDTLKVFVERGGRVVDTAPSYGDAESILGRYLTELGIRDQLFLATKVDREGRDEGIAGMRRSLDQLATNHVDLMQVHNLRDVETQLGTLLEWKQDGTIRYLGVTTSSDRQYESMKAVAETRDLDFIQVDYALGNRNAADDLLPIAEERGIAVLINMPFGRGDAFRRVGDRAVPEWAAEIGIASWGQFFLKYVVSHPAVTAAIPGTTKPHHAEDNVGAMLGELPDAALRRRMEEFYDELPDPG